MTILSLFVGCATGQSIAAGSRHGLAVCDDSTVHSWGENVHGQLGNGTSAVFAYPDPTIISGLSDVVAVEGGSAFSLFLKADGTVLSCGKNSGGQLGNGTYTPYDLPSPTVLTDVVAIRAGTEHAIALKEDSTAWSWGYNTDGQMGNGTMSGGVITPVQASTLTGVIAVDAGYRHSLAVLADGTVWAWGSNDHWQLGDSLLAQSSLPIQVPGLSDVIAVEAASESSYALKSDGSVWSWGGDLYGQLGNGPDPASATPQQVAGLTGIAAIRSSTMHVIALKNDGSVWLWGSNIGGTLGNGTTSGFETSPWQNTALSGIVAVAAGSNFSMTLKNDGTIMAFGVNDKGQLGNGTTVQSPVPTASVLNCALLTGVSTDEVGNLLDVHPNPTSGKLIVSAPSGAEVRIINSSGLVVLRSSVIAPTIELDLSQQLAGAYTVQLINADRSARCLVIKE